jgi:hypothetical protein
MPYIKIRQRLTLRNAQISLINGAFKDLESGGELFSAGFFASFQDPRNYPQSTH